MPFPEKMFCAPMAGVSDKPFREMIRLYPNAPIFTTEMISVESLIYKKTQQNIRLLNLKDEKNMIVQLVGTSPTCFAKAAQKAQEAGATQIDINMGCAVKKIIQKGAGCTLTRNIAQACKIVQAVKNAVSLPVSVKTRLTPNLPELAKALFETGICALAIHARTPQEGYATPAHWEQIAPIADMLPIPIIINGGVINKQTAQTALIRSHAANVMIGQAALGTPWIFHQILSGKENTRNIYDLMLLHLEKMLSFYGTRTGLLNARKHLNWYLKHIPTDPDFKKHLLTQQNPTTVQKMILSEKEKNQ